MNDTLAIIAEHAEVVIDDTDLASREDWLQARTTGLGGSDAAAALGLSPWRSRYALWDEKTRDELSDEDNELLKWGRRLEPIIIQAFTEETGIKADRLPQMLRSREYPWMTVNLDAVILDEPSIVEAKNTGWYQAGEWSDDEGQATVPDHYGAQGQHALAVTGLDSCWFSVLIGGNDFRRIKVERDPALIADLVEMERAFWDLVEAGTPPALDSSDSTTHALKARFANPAIGTTVEVSPVVGELIAHRAALKVQKKTLDEELALVDNNLKAAVGNAEVATVNGEPVFSWKYVERDGYVVAPGSYRRLIIPSGRRR
jgi:putative phage-type endonuclease